MLFIFYQFNKKAKIISLSTNLFARIDKLVLFLYPMPEGEKMKNIITSSTAILLLLAAPALFAQPFDSLKVLDTTFYYSPQQTSEGETSYVYYPRGENEDNYSSKLEIMHMPAENPLQQALDEEGQDDLGVQKAYACPDGNSAVVAWISVLQNAEGESQPQLYMLSKIDSTYTLILSGEFDLEGSDFSPLVDNLCAFELPQ